MAIPVKQQRKVLQRSGNMCAFPDCHRLLTVSTANDALVVLGHIAHIVAERADGPRGQSSMSLKERNSYENLLLMCNLHHQLIDAECSTFTVERLHGIKQQHERWVESTLSAAVGTPSVIEPLPLIEDRLHSTLMRVEHMPSFVYGAPCDIQTDKEVAQRVGPLHKSYMAPCIVRGGMLWAFQDPSNGSPYREVVDRAARERYAVEEWWTDPDKMKWFVQLLNRSLNKLTGRLGLHFDKDHHRYYFPMEVADQERSVTYRPLNRAQAVRKVVWRPIKKSTGEGRNYWLHRGVSLRFIHAGEQNWCLGVRPELRVTKDGFESLDSKWIGAKVTRKKSRLFNYDLLQEVQFWRDFLSGSSPRILFPFGSSAQSIIVSTRLMQGQVAWPGIPEEHRKAFSNVDYVDDLFSWGELKGLDEGGYSSEELDEDI